MSGAAAGRDRARGPRLVALGVTGASGAIYAKRTIEHLGAAGGVEEIALVVSDSGYRVIDEELGIPRRDLAAAAAAWAGGGKLRLLPNGDIGASLASGSTAPDAMAVVPCSMGSLAAIASGLATTLMRRGADVMLKERRPLVLVPREAPYNLIHLENMERVMRAGAHLVPASPGFYHHPATIEELVDQIVAKVLDLLGVPHSIAARWQPTSQGPVATVGAKE